MRAATPSFSVDQGDPEGFLYRGAQNPDGTRAGDQLTLINKLATNGGNGIYFQMIRSHGGDGDSTHNPFVNNDPAQGLNTAVLDQWETWFAAMDQAGILIYAFFYDDSASVWGGGNSVPAEEQAFLEAIVNRFKHHQHLVWVIAEEYQEAFTAARVANMAAIIRVADTNGHPIGVHKLSGLSFSEFANDPNIDQFAIQYNVPTAQALHDGMVSAFADAAGRYNLNMSEAAGHGTGTTARRKNWAVAMGGAYVMVLGWDIAGTSTSDLQGCGRLETFMETTNFAQMNPRDDLGFDGTQYVLGDPATDSYILYASALTGEIGVRNIEPGPYDLHWLDIPSGTVVDQVDVFVGGGDTTFPSPAGIGSELAVWVRPAQSTSNFQTLDVSVTGTGEGTVTSNPVGINCPGVCSAEYALGFSVTLTAAVGTNSIFSGWSGGVCDGSTASTCTVMMNQAQNVDAQFSSTLPHPPQSVVLSLTVEGSGTINQQGGQFTCNTAALLCAMSFPEGTEVTLQAIPENGATFSSWQGCDSTAIDSCSITMSTNKQVTGTFVGSGPEFQQAPGVDGLVSLEAEHAHRNTSQGGHSWTISTSPTGFSGTSAMMASPNNGTNNNTNYVSNSPGLDFDVHFVHTGTHYVWIRGVGPSGTDDSVHVGLDGQELSTSDRISSLGSNWTWTNQTMNGVVATMNVPTVGIHTVTLWMREDGTSVDKIVLTTNANFQIPVGEGPAKSPQGNPQPDTTPPTVTMTAPIHNSTISGTVALAASATDNGTGIAGVQFMLDEVGLGSEDTTFPYSITWDTTSVAPGPYTLTAMARDGEGNIAVSSDTIVSVVAPRPSEGPLVSNIQVASGASYGVDTLASGKKIYVDRSYTFTGSYPASLDGQLFIRTANNDKFGSGSSFLTFDVATPVTVYVLMDSRTTQAPSWLSEGTWRLVPGLVGTTDIPHVMYARLFPPGPIVLGGNGDSPVVGAGSMYSVVVIPSQTTPVELMGVALTGTNGLVEVGQTQQLMAMGTYSDGSIADISASVTWTSSEPTVATLSGTGVLTGVALGTTNLTVRQGRVTSPAVHVMVKNKNGSEGTELPESDPIVSNVTVSNGKSYAVDTLFVGKALYIDRTYTYTGIPSTFDGQPYIRTANGDKFRSGPTFLTFDVATPVIVKVLMDTRATRVPAWLGDGTWTLESGSVGTTDIPHVIYSKGFPVGRVTLGGNGDSPMVGARSMYSVVVISTPTSPVVFPAVALVNTNG